MDPLSAVDDQPPGLGPAPARGRLRRCPEDFQVTELPVCAPDGAGEHVWLRVRKRGQNTQWVARELARHAGVALGQVSYAGLKDRHAVTEQWFSVHLPGREAPPWEALDSDGVTVLEHRRHGRKLRRGALRGNRFRLRVTDLQGDAPALERRLEQLRQRGAANYFGPQRFGRGGANLQAAAALFAGRLRRVSRQQRGLYLSAARSQLFNRVLAARVRGGTWDRPMDGDVLQPDGSHGWFSAPPGDPAVQQRADRLEIHPTGPLWGRGELPTQGACRGLELEAVRPWHPWCEGLAAAGLEQERRALRIRVEGLHWALEGETLELGFTLPRGAYATAVLNELIAPAAPGERAGGGA